MDRDLFTSDTILDLAVNAIPLSIVLFFILLFAVVNPWGFDLLASGFQFGLMFSMVLGLIIVTYYVARAIESDHTHSSDSNK